MTLKLALAALALTAAVPAAAERSPTTLEKTLVGKMLTDSGYKKWDEIEIKDGGRWIKVDDAVSADGKRNDLRLVPSGFTVEKVLPK